MVRSTDHPNQSSKGKVPTIRPQCLFQRFSSLLFINVPLPDDVLYRLVYYQLVIQIANKLEND
jgi:hypothetical protein